MGGDRVEPPERERPGPHPGTGPNRKSADTTTDKPIICHTGLAGWSRRRSQAAQHMAPLDCPGRCRDPLLKCRCEPPPPPPSPKMVDAAAQAALHLLDTA